MPPRKHVSVADLALRQAGVVTRAQVAARGGDPDWVARQVAARRWQTIGPVVLATFTGEPTRLQRMWAGVLHGGDRAVIGGITALESLGIRRWSRDEVTVLIPKSRTTRSLPGVRYVETRRDLCDATVPRLFLPMLKAEPAALLWAGYEKNRRTAEGLISAVVQQELATPDSLRIWIDRLQPLRRTQQLRRLLDDLDGGSQSLAEVDLARVVRRHGLPRPHRQTKRRDSSGRVRFTDAEWILPDGTIIMLEVDGGFHMEVEHWQDDISRARALARPGVVQLKCTARELRDDPRPLVSDLRRLGIGRSSA